MVDGIVQKSLHYTLRAVYTFRCCHSAHQKFNIMSMVTGSLAEWIWNPFCRSTIDTMLNFDLDYDGDGFGMCKTHLYLGHELGPVTPHCSGPGSGHGSV